MKIEYTLTESGKCLTECPKGIQTKYGHTLGVSSTYCYQCEHFVSDEEDENEGMSLRSGVVTCNCLPITEEEKE